MLHVKFYDHGTSDCDEIFQRFWPCINMAAITKKFKKRIMSLPLPKKAPHKIYLYINRPSSLREDVENDDHIHVYRTRAGADIP